MINIDDIRKRLLENPEPQEVKDIRNLITSKFRNLEFFEGPHKYFLHNPDGTQTELPSVSGVIKQFEPESDWDEICKRTAKNRGMDPEVLKRQWTETNLTSTSNGTKTHFFLENLMNLWIYGESGLDPEISHYQYEKGFLIPYGPKELAGTKFFEFVLGRKNVFPIMPEAKIYTGFNPEFKFKQDYCGTFDVLMGTRDEVTGKITPFLMDWKGLPLNTKILTTKGFKTMGDLKVGDKVYDKDGYPTSILHVSEVHHNPCYKIKFKNWDSIVADVDHRWLVYIGKDERVMTTNELCDYMKKHPGETPKIPIASALKGYNHHLGYSPFKLGSDLMEKGGRIPEEIFTSTYNERFEVLCGLMKKKINFYEEGKTIVIVVEDKCLKEDIETLISTLGMKSTTSSYTICNIATDEPEKTKYNIYFNLKSEFNRFSSPEYRYIENISETITIPTKCIEVDSPTHTYLATNKLIVTHNTNKSLIKQYNRDKHKMMLPPFQDMVDEPLSHYTLQLSCYQMGIQQLGLEISHRIIIWLKEDGTYELIPVPDVTDRLKLIL